MSTGQNDAEFYDKFHPTVKDVEANAEERRRKILGKDPKKVFCSFRKFGPMAQIGEADDEEKNSPV
jgi:DNA topoisomerase-1